MFRLSLLSLALVFSTGSATMAREYLCGYDRSLIGGGFPYHAPQPDAATSLLIRAESDTARIAWLTEPVPATATGDALRFVMLAAIDVNAEDPRRWTVRVDDRDAFTVTTPREPVARDLVWPGPDGASLALIDVQVDKYDDLMGHLVLTVPRAWTQPGRPLRLEVRGEGALSRTWFMVYEYAARDRVRVVPEQAVRREPGGPSQVLQVEVVRYAPPGPVAVAIGPHRFAMDLAFGYNVHYLAVPEITGEVALPVTVTAADAVLYAGEVRLRPVARRTVHLLAHSHVDIGYTHEQAEVERIQWRNLDEAVALAARTRDLTPDARFRWNTEVAWAVESYLRQAAPAGRAALVDALRAGEVELDALFANELTALCSPAELLESTAAARRIAADCGVELTAAMLTDIPGVSWALVPVLAQSGVRYFSIGPNRGHRIGHVLARWGDRPFWWESPSGEERVLCWVHGEGYSLFHTRMYAPAIDNRLVEPTLLPYLARLADAGYPHETVTLRYSVGSDNGPPHEAMPEIVRDWNERYLTPRLVISTVTAAFAALEREAGPELPVVRGDLTAFWEDGAASSARETASARRSADRLAQAETAWALRNPRAFPQDEFAAAWRDVLLWSEHTWGSWNSISEPDAELTRNQWTAKRAFARAAEASSRRLLAAALADPGGAPAADAIEVLNTETWPRSDLARVPAELAGSRARVLDDQGREVPAQRLRSGELAFVARDVPALGSRTYRLAAGDPGGGPGPFAFTADGLASDAFVVRVDPDQGSIRSLLWQTTATELVDPADPHGLNGYLYVPGRDPAAAQTVPAVRVEPGERGPVVASVRITAAAPGCASLEREIVLVAGLARVELVNTLDKTAVRAPEAVHFALPFGVADPVVRYDLAFGLCRLEIDQLPGANRNYVTAAHAVDVSGDGFGVTVACPDAPIVEVGALRADPIVVGWLEQLTPSATLYAYVMNNYWETNYRAEQPGLVSLRFRLVPHDAFDAVAMRRAGVEARRPLLVAPVGTGTSARPVVARPVGSGLEVVSWRPRADGGVVMALYNAGDEAVTVGWSPPPARVRACGLDGVPAPGPAGDLTLPARGLRCVIVEGLRTTR